MLRQLIEYLSRGVILKRKLPAEFDRRTIYVSPEGGGLRYFQYDLEKIDPMLLNVVRGFIKTGATVWDVGGNLGYFAFTSVIKSNGGQVAIFEPDLFLAHLLRKSADKNPDLNIDIFPFAASSTNGLARFNIAARARATNYLDMADGSSQTGGIRKSINVPTITLDTVLTWYHQPDFVKIDTEGAELLVLQGMKKILTDIRPVILCEVSDSARSAVSEIFKSHNYQMFDAQMLPQKIEIQLATDNILAIPV